MGKVDKFIKTIFIIIFLITLSNCSNKTAESYNSRGISKHELKDYKGAIADFTIAIELDSNSAMIYINRGISKAYLEDGGTLEDFLKAIEIDPDFAIPFIGRILNTDESGNYKEAKSIHDIVNSYYFRGIEKTRLEDYEEAIAYFSIVIEFQPANARAYYFRGISKLMLDQNDSGCLDLSKAGELGHSDAYDAIKEHCK